MLGSPPETTRPDRWRLDITSSAAGQVFGTPLSLPWPGTDPLPLLVGGLLGPGVLAATVEGVVPEVLDDGLVGVDALDVGLDPQAATANPIVTAMTTDPRLPRSRRVVQRGRLDIEASRRTLSHAGGFHLADPDHHWRRSQLDRKPIAAGAGHARAASPSVGHRRAGCSLARTWATSSITFSLPAWSSRRPCRFVHAGRRRCQAHGQPVLAALANLRRFGARTEGRLRANGPARLS